MLESSAATYTNPVHPDYFADPCVWRCGSDYYAVGTGQAEAAGLAVTASSPSVFPLLHSRDLVRWRAAGHALVRPDPAPIATGKTTIPGHGLLLFERTD